MDFIVNYISRTTLLAKFAEMHIQISELSQFLGKVNKQ